MSIIAHTMPFMIMDKKDLMMAHTCLKSLSESTQDQVLVVYNQGYLKNEQLELFFNQYPIRTIILGEGENIGIPAGRQKCFEYIWANMPEVKYISEIHVDMIFTPDWSKTIMNYLEISDEPMMSPSILTGYGELHPEKKGIKSVDVPSSYEEILSLLPQLTKDDVCEGLVHPVIHKAEILKKIGGYDLDFLKGKQGYEDDSILLGYRYYMGTKNNWRPKALLSVRVFHISLIQRMKMDNIHKETNKNLDGLINQYGIYGLLQLDSIHHNNQFKQIALSKMDNTPNRLNTKVNQTSNKRVLIASPVHQKSEILKLFLESLKNINREKIDIDYLFYDDNSDEISSKLLREFKDRNSKVTVKKGIKETGYICNNVSHYWKEDLIWKVAGYKDRMIEEAINNDYDYIFLIDSDLLIYPQTIEQLMNTQKDIISNIFWTKWNLNQPLMPNVWLSGVYCMVDKKREEELSDEEVINRYKSFIQKMYTPGIYEVGGLGACTLISRKALVSGVNFKEIENVSYWGEDRHFCIRAKALGHKLFVDTRNPVYHIYRESDIDGGKIFLNQFNKVKPNIKSHTFTRYYKEKNNKLVLSMVIKNEAGRYLEQVLTHAKKYIDEAVIIDDGSQDNSVEICRQILEDIPIHIIKNSTSKFSNEIELRKQQWNETIKVKPDWILNLDADEVFEEAIVDEIKQLINQKQIDVYYFRLYDFWDENHYRDDKYWSAHNTYRPFLLRYQKDFPYKWLEQPQHCGRLPHNIQLLPRATSQLRLKHYGWAKYEDRLEKYNRYMALDPDAKYGWKEQYESILDEQPKLTKW